MIMLMVFLIMYCLFHSVLADADLMKWIYTKWWYRMFYVVQSVVLLIPILYVYILLPSEPLYTISDNMSLLFRSLQGVAVVFAVYASRSYDNRYFLGIGQIMDRYRSDRLSFHDHKEFVLTGALQYVRHPYYSAGLVFIWFRPLYQKDLVVNVIFTVYFILGAVNEERKLIKYFGSTYRDYQQRVPMLIPRLWRKI